MRLTLSVLLGILPIAATTARAATITVTSLADSGLGSLREAVAAAAPGDTIDFGVAGTIVLGSPLTIDKSLTIVGPGATGLILSGNDAVRVFTIAPSATVSLSGLTITKGYDPSAGGGIYSEGTLTLTDSIVSNSKAHDVDGGGQSGGGDGGGGILNRGTMSIVRSAISSNLSYIGGGVYNMGTLTVTDSKINLNTGATLRIVGLGPGVYNAGTLTVSNSNVTENKAMSAGAGTIFNDDNATLIVDRTLFFRNHVAVCGYEINYPGGGAAIFSRGSVLSVVNSTFTLNSAGVCFLGSVIAVQGGAAFVGNSTITRNNVRALSAALYDYTGSNAALTVKNSIISTNVSDSCRTSGGTIVDAGYNLTTDALCGSYLTAPSSRLVTDVGLATSLRNNGGLWLSIALVPGPAIDAIPLAACTDGAGTSLLTDTRGVTRPQGAACDIGAFEAEAVPPDTAPPVLTLPAPITVEATNAVGMSVTFTASANDVNDGSVAMTCIPASGSTFSFGTTTVECSATDAAGNKGTGSFPVTVVDTTPPVVTVPSSFTVAVASAAGTPVTFTSSAVDNIDGVLATVCAPASGATFGIGTRTVYCSATDSPGNTATATFVVTVVDTTPPVPPTPIVAQRHVTSLADDGPGSLRAVITAAAPGDTIDFSVTGTIGLASTLIVDKNVTIAGPGADRVSLSGNYAVRVLYIASSATVSLSGVTVTEGFDVLSGGGIYSDGRLTLTDSVVQNNGAGPGGAVTHAGGGIFNAGVLSVVRGVVSGNGATGGGGIYNSGTMIVTDSRILANRGPAFESGYGSGAYNAGTMEVNNSSVSDNRAPLAGSGGGIYNFGTLTVRGTLFLRNGVGACTHLSSTGSAIMSFNGQMSIDNSTFVANTTGACAVIGIYGGWPSYSSNNTIVRNFGRAFSVDGQLTVKNTIVAGNLAGSCIATAGSIADAGYNLTTDAGCAAHLSAPSSMFVLDAGLPDSPRFNGGPWVSLALLPGSPAIDAVPVAACTDDAGNPLLTDMRGRSRPQGSACDIGAFEVESSAPSDPTPSDTTPPVVTVPATIMQEAAGPSGAAVSFSVSATDGIDGAVAASCTPGSDSTFAIGTTPVTCAAQDAHGNTGSATFLVTIVDTTPPVLTLPAPITVNATSPSGAVVSFAASAADLVNGSIAVSCAPASGSAFSVGTTTVSCTAADSRGNTAAGTFGVTVLSAAQMTSSLAASEAIEDFQQGLKLLQNALTNIGTDTAAACGQLSAFVNQATAQAGKKLTIAQAHTLIGAALSAKAALGCP